MLGLLYESIDVMKKLAVNLKWCTEKQLFGFRTTPRTNPLRDADTALGDRLRHLKNKYLSLLTKSTGI